MIDVACEEILSLRHVWPDVPINLCLWHVRRAWTKNLIAKVKNPFNRADLNRDLRDLMYDATEDSDAESLAFMAKWCEAEPAFTQYYELFWHPKQEQWMKNFCRYDHQNQNTNGAIERWHHTMKMHLRTEKATKHGRTIIWLVGMLTDDLELFYWCMLSLKFQGAIVNQVKQGYVWASIHKARLISDSDVRYVDSGPDGGRRAEVTTFKADGIAKVHIVDNYDKDNCTCTCGHSEQGNTCKHQLKILRMEGYTEMKLFNLLGTKWGSCCGGLEYEYETMAEDTVDGGDVDLPWSPTDGVDISFPLKSFATVEEAPVDDEPAVYHEYKIDYILGLVEKGWKNVEKLSPIQRNQAVVKLREWIEWLSNQEALENPPDLSDFPVTGFIKPVGSESTLKRKKDHVEQYWDKRGRKGGKTRKSKSATQTEEHQCDLSGWDGVSTSSRKDKEVGMTDPGPPRAAECEEANLKSDATQPLPFKKPDKVKESDQQMLDRLARESLNLNQQPMDYEPATAPPSCAGTKRRGRPLGSKNKGKVLAPRGVDTGPSSRAVLSSVKTNIIRSTQSDRLQIAIGKENFAGREVLTVSDDTCSELVIRID